MKIQCDVCDKNLAAVMCCADEAALCTECDARIHTANKLANKHVRVGLHGAPDPPKCDICQEKRGFFFCLEDRALLCRDCDVSIHTANTLSCNHKRFLVPGTRVALEELQEDHPVPEPVIPEVVVLSSTVSLPSSLSSHYSHRSPTSTLQAPRNSTGTATLQPTGAPAAAPVFTDSTRPFAPCCSPAAPPYSSGNNLQQNAVPGMKRNGPEFRTPPAPLSNSVPATGGMKKSSISEFLTAAVPGWRVDELLNFPDPTTPEVGTTTTGFAGDFTPVKTGIVDTAGGDYDWTAELSFFEEHMFAMHEVPQFPPPTPVAAPPRGGSMRGGAPRNNRNSGKLQDMFLNNHCNSHYGSRYDDAFIVPDIGMPSGPISPPTPKRFKRDLYHI